MTGTDPAGIFPDPRERPWLRVDEAGRWLGLGRSAAYDGVARGDIPSIRIGGRIVVPTAALARMLQLDEPKPAA